MTFYWTEDQDRIFRALINEGQPVAFAAKAIGKTRNAGCGRLWRQRQRGVR